MNATRLKQQRKQMVQRFRRLVRTVIMNLSWLVDQSDQKFSMNVKKNIEMVVRVSRNIGFLTSKDKSMIRTPHKIRTVEDRRTLVHLLLGLDCFKTIPPKIRARLVPVVDFLNCQKGKIIIKEGQEASFVYYILTGEVLCTKKEYDATRGEYFEKSVSVYIPGDCIGDVELIENTPRLCTYIANSDIELLVVEKQHFDRILLSFLKARWTELKNAIKSLEYLNFFTEFQVWSACKIGQIVQYEALQTVYSDDKGKLGFTYFVLQGECTIMQNLKIKITEVDDKKSFELVSINDEAEDVDGNLDEVELLRMIKEKGQGLHQTAIDYDFELSDDEADKKIEQHHADLKKTYVQCEKYKEKTDEKSSSSSIHTSSIDAMHYEDDDIYRNYQYQKSATVSNTTEYSSEIDQNATTDMQQDLFADQSQGEQSTRGHGHERLHSKNTERSMGSRLQNDQRESDFLTLTEEMEEDMMSKFTFREKRYSSAELYKFETHFIEVGTIGPGGVFGLGEELKQRIICANSMLQCLVIPRFWLLEPEQNPRNIWPTRKFHLEHTIPTRQELFEYFMKTRKWKKFRNSYVQSILDQKFLYNCAKVQDIPAIGRILEGTDDDS